MFYFPRTFLCLCLALAMAYPALAQNNKNNNICKDPCEKTIPETKKDIEAAKPVPCTPKDEKEKTDIIASAEDKNLYEQTWDIITKKKTFETFKWGLDERIREEYVKNAFRLTHDEKNRNYFRFRTRIWLQYDPWEWISVYLRFTNEGRAWVTPNVKSDGDEIIFDNFYVDLKRPYNLPISVRFGRQDLFGYGQGFILMDGTPGDGSRTHYFDAIKSTLHLDAIKTNIDTFVIETNREERKFFKINPTDRLEMNHVNSRKTLAEDEIDAYGYYLTSNYFGDIFKLEHYYFYKEAHGRPLARRAYGNNQKLNTFGGRISGTLFENFKYESELAGQFGKQGPEDRQGLGAYTIGSYFFPVQFKPSVSTGYYYLSGDNPRTPRREDWDPLFSRWPLHGDLLLFTYAREGGIARWTNMHKYLIGGGACPTSWWSIKLVYNRLWADENTFLGTTGFGTGNNRGDLIELINKFEINKYVSSFIQIEYFEPGDYYARTADSAFFLRWELKFTY